MQLFILTVLAIFCIQTISCYQPLTSEVLNAIMIGRDQILAKTKPEDLLVFVGNSASYFYHAVKTRRESFLVPISDHRPILGKDAVSSMFRSYIQESYRAGFEKPYVTPFTDIASEAKRRIVLIDYSGSGQSVDGFDELVKLTCADCFTVFLALQTNSMKLSKDPENVSVVGYANLPEVANGLFDDAYTRLTPYFPTMWWDSSSPSIMTDHESQPEVKTAIEQISQMSEQEPPSDINVGSAKG